MKPVLVVILFLVAAWARPVVAEKHDTATTMPAQAGGQLTEGEVRKVDKETKKITIRHGPIQSLDMPAMTMVFQVKDPAMLDQVKTGDKVSFEAEKVGTTYTVTRIVPVQNK